MCQPEFCSLRGRIIPYPYKEVAVTNNLYQSILAIPYVTLHLRAAKTNFSIIRSQPFQHPLHSWTIIVARLAFLAWAVAVIASSVAVARASGDKVHLQLDLFFCVTSL